MNEVAKNALLYIYIYIRKLLFLFNQVGRFNRHSYPLFCGYTLFGQKVKETLASPLGVIDYDNLTYGDISSTIRNEGMKMCRDLKIQSQANTSKTKYEIGNFYTQYGLPSVIPKRKFKHKGEEPSKKSHRKKTASKYHRKQKFKTDDFYKKGKSKSTRTFIPKTSRKCFTCGKKGHFQKECKAKAKSLINPSLVTKPVRQKSSNS